MNIAMIIAGGKGLRMNQDIPKQFSFVNDKPVIIYTLEAFESHPGIDEIGVVCVEGWHEILSAFAKQYKITKLKWIVNGGENGQESIRNGITEAEKRYKSTDIILIHDAVRPLVTADVITSCIVECKQYGSAISVMPETTVVLRSVNGETSSEVIDRSKLFRTQTPQALPLATLTWAHNEAAARGIHNAVATCSLMIDLGKEVHFSLGSDINIKLTTPGDLQIFKAILLQTTAPNKDE